MEIIQPLQTYEHVKYHFAMTAQQTSEFLTLFQEEYKCGFIQINTLKNVLVYVKIKEL